MRAGGLAALALLATGGCISKKVCTPAANAAAGTPRPEWRDAVTNADHEKIRALRPAFVEGLNAARTAGFGAAIAAQGRLFDPDFAEEGVALPAGAYTCRTFTLGTKEKGRAAFFAEPAQACTIAQTGALQHFEERGGPQRLVGRIYPDASAREILLGVIVLADEATALHYSRDVDRDTIGAIARIGDRRWRLTVPRPKWQSIVAVTEIRPAGAPAQSTQPSPVSR